MPDLDAISTALAARYAAAAITPPGGFQNVRSSTNDPPNQLRETPCVVVSQTSANMQTGNGTRIGTFEYAVRFYYAQATLADLSRDMDALVKWETVLIDQLRLSAQLGGIVAVARAMSSDYGIMRYGGSTYSGVQITVAITTTEAWLAVS